MAPDVLRRTPHDDGMLDRTGILCASTPVRGHTAPGVDDDPLAEVPRVPRSSLAGAAAAVLMLIVAIGAVTDRDLRPHGPSPAVADGDSGAVGPSARSGSAGDAEPPAVAVEGTGPDPADDSSPDPAPVDDPDQSGADPAEADPAEADPAEADTEVAGTPGPLVTRDDVAAAGTLTEAISVPERSTAPMSAPGGARADLGAARFDLPHSARGDTRDRERESSVSEEFAEVAERYRDHRDSSDLPDPEDLRDSQDLRDSREVRDSRQVREFREVRDSREVREFRESSAAGEQDDRTGHDRHGRWCAADRWDRDR